MVNVVAPGLQPERKLGDAADRDSLGLTSLEKMKKSAHGR